MSTKKRSHLLLCCVYNHFKLCDLCAGMVVEKKRMSMQSAEPTDNLSKAFFASLPKVELHRHLEGSLRISTMSEVARKHGMPIGGTGQLRSLVQVQGSDPYTFQNFLSKFATLRQFYRSPDVIGRVTREAIADAAADNVRYMELRFTPVALSNSQGYPLGEVMDWVITQTEQANREFGIDTRLIISMNRHESVEIAERTIQAAVDRMGRGVIGIDLAGNEAEFSALPFAGLFREARRAGLHITVHAGEWGRAVNVADAINHLSAERIGHGVNVLEDPAVVSLAREVGMTFEVCITSNYQSGVAPTLEEHPIRKMLAEGLKITLNTDDPSICAITLADEYQTACTTLGVNLRMLKERILAAAQASFLPEARRQILVQRLAAELDQISPA